MTGVIFVVLIFLLLGYTCWPLLEDLQPLTVDGEEIARRRAPLEQEKLNNLQALRDIDFERTLGKVSEADHRQLKELYTRQAAAAINALDKLAKGDKATTDADG